MKSQSIVPATVSVGVLIALLSAGTSAHAVGVPGDAAFLDSAVVFSVLGGATVTNTGPSVLNAGLGVSPGSATTGFPPGLVGTATHSNDAVAIQAQIDVVTAANAIMAVPSLDVGTADLDGMIFLAGAYSSASSLLNTGTITLRGDADDVFIFTAVSTLTTGAGSTIVFDGDVQECNVFWRLGSSATLGAGSLMVGTVIAQAAITANTGAIIAGRLLAQVEAVTLQANVFTAPTCDTAAGDGVVAPPVVLPPVPSPSGPTGPVLEVPPPVVPEAPGPDDGGTDTPDTDGPDTDTPGASPESSPAGTVETLAATGSESTPVAAFVSAGVVLLGVGFLAVARRGRGRNLLRQQDVR